MATQPYNIGSGKNYVDLKLHRADKKGTGTDTHELTLFDDQVLTSELRYYSGEFSKVVLKPDAGREFVARFADENNRVVKSDGVMTGSIVQIANVLECHDIEVNGGSSYPIYQDNDSELIYLRCGIKATSSYALNNRANTTVTDCLVLALTSNAAYNVSNSANFTAINSIIVGNSLYGAVRNRFGNTSLNQCLILNNHASGADVTNEANTLTGDYNVSSDASAPGENSLHNQPIDTWFVDAANGDYRINAIGQTALKGKAPGGGDLLSWAYEPLSSNDFSGSVTVTSSNSFVNKGEKSVSGSVVVTNNTAINTHGTKASLGASTANAVITVNTQGEKQSSGSTTANSTTTIDTTGFKSSLGSHAVNVVNSFIVSGTSAEIIARSGSSIVTSTNSITTRGEKSSQASHVANATNGVHTTGEKSIAGSATVNALASIFTSGFKSSFGASIVNVSNTFVVTGYSDSFTPVIRRIMINGDIVSLLIPCNITNQITINGAI